MPRSLVIPEYLMTRHRRTTKSLRQMVGRLILERGRTGELLQLDRYMEKLRIGPHRNRLALIRLKEGLERLSEESDIPEVQRISETATTLIRDILLITKGTGT